MEKTINILLFCNFQKKPFLLDGLRRFENINIIGHVSNTDALMSTIIQKENNFVLVCYVNINFLELAQLFGAIKTYKLQSIFICDEVAHGFEFLAKGATAIAPISKETNYSSFFSVLSMKIKNAYASLVSHDERVLKAAVNKTFQGVSLIAIGSSTGGTETVSEILQQLPAEMPPIVIVQHMPPVFTKLYAERMNQTCRLTVWEAQDGDKLVPGLVLIAPGNYQLKVYEKQGSFYVSCEEGERVSGHCPSVDVLFNSVANAAGSASIGVILTGMGSDGANGLLSMKKKNAYTIGQDQQSSIVYGMPRVAYEIGAVTEQADCKNIPKLLMDRIK